MVSFTLQILYMSEIILVISWLRECVCVCVCVRACVCVRLSFGVV